MGGGYWDGVSWVRKISNLNVGSEITLTEMLRKFNSVRWLPIVGKLFLDADGTRWQSGNT